MEEHRGFGKCGCQHGDIYLVWSQITGFDIVWFPLTTTYEVSSVAELGFRTYAEIILKGSEGRGKLFACALLPKCSTPVPNDLS